MKESSQVYPKPPELKYNIKSIKQSSYTFKSVENQLNSIIQISKGRFKLNSNEDSFEASRFPKSTKSNFQQKTQFDQINSSKQYEINKDLDNNDNASIDIYHEQHEYANQNSNNFRIEDLQNSSPTAILPLVISPKKKQREHKKIEPVVIEEVKPEEIPIVQKHKHIPLPWNSVTSYIHCYPREQRVKVEEEKAKRMRRKDSVDHHSKEQLAPVEHKEPEIVKQHTIRNEIQVEKEYTETPKHSVQHENKEEHIIKKINK